MRYLFLLMQFFFISLSLEDAKAREVLSNQENTEDDTKEFDRHKRNYGITLYNLFKFLGKNSYIDNSVKIRIDDLVGSNLQLLRALKLIEERKEYPSLYLRSDGDDDLTGSLFEEDEETNHGNKNSKKSKKNRGKSKDENSADPKLTEENNEIEENSESESEENDSESSESSESDEEENTASPEPAAPQPIAPQPAAPQPAVIIPFDANNGQTPNAVAVQTNPNNIPPTPQSTEQEDSNDQSDAEQTEGEQTEGESPQENQFNTTPINETSIPLIQNNGSPSDMINLSDDSFAIPNQNLDMNFTNNGNIYNGTVNQNHITNSDGTSWGGILGGVAGGAALGIIGTTLYNSENNQNEYGMTNNYGNQNNMRNSDFNNQTSSVDLMDDSVNLNNQENFNQSDQIVVSEQYPATQTNLNEEDFVENSDDSDKNSESDQADELENEENSEEVAESTDLENQNANEEFIDNVPTNQQLIQEIGPNNNVLLPQFGMQTPYNAGSVQQFGMQTPYNAGSVQQFGMQTPYNVGSVQQFGMQTPYNVGSVQQFGMQTPYNVGSVQQFGMQTPYNVDSVQQFGMQTPSNSVTQFVQSKQQPKISPSYDDDSLQSLNNEETQSIRDELIDQEETKVGNNSSSSQQRSTSYPRPKIKQGNRAVRKIIKGKNEDIYIRSKKNIGPQQSKTSIIPVRQAKENEPLKMIQDLADNKIHAYHF